MNVALVAYVTHNNNIAITALPHDEKQPPSRFQMTPDEARRLIVKLNVALANLPTAIKANAAIVNAAHAEALEIDSQRSPYPMMDWTE
jgi:hypothetical protein